ncbi:MAG: alpha-galactosidase, partial [bacterium]|nr:alpha-galactosidase [bacterium]
MVLKPSAAPRRFAFRVYATPALLIGLILVIGAGTPGPRAQAAAGADMDPSTRTKKEQIPMADPLERLRAVAASGVPFSFTYGGQESGKLLAAWTTAVKIKRLADGRHQATVTWKDPNSGLELALEAAACPDFPAVDWVIYFENKGGADTPVIENVQVLDRTCSRPLPGLAPFRLQKLRGGVPNPTMFESTEVSLLEGMNETIGSLTGRPSTRNMPFFRLETGEGIELYALEWSGTWQAVFDCKGGALRARAGMEKTHFVLRPGERVRMPRVLTLRFDGPPDEAQAGFRRLIYKYYTPRRADKEPDPLVFCNTCFTRGGGWLNETTADNQISLIRAYAALGAEAIITDAGWFDGGWPSGAGNYTPRKDHYPQGMAPVAAAARDAGIVYGLWFEPERVVAGTRFHQDHPDWVLAVPGQTHTYLADFGRKEVQDHFFNIVKGFMALPGFRVYRQDFNMDPLPYWRANDAPDRQGITEIRYVEGLYAYWERIRRTWPDCLMEECASGGHRIELGTVMRMD